MLHLSSILSYFSQISAQKQNFFFVKPLLPDLSEEPKDPSKKKEFAIHIKTYKYIDNTDKNIGIDFLNFVFVYNSEKIVLLCYFAKLICVYIITSQGSYFNMSMN